ncbi:uncharacterized protein LOC135848860 [Planococcus citri]|uniref:uncharacterized protein LOC135848860 n=1 Tax=Planococcus citri TaxID=170843 RepID=UPI0031F831E4
MGNPTKLRSLAAKSSCIQLVFEWASCEMTVTKIWVCPNVSYRTCPAHDRFIWQLGEMEIPERSVISKLVLNKIEYHMASILNHVIQWICYHHRKNFFHDEPASPLKEYLLKLIWKPDRSIDYEATAKNVLAGSNFNPMEKYRFACTYCFEEDLRNLRDMAPVTMDCDFEKEPLLVYWSKYLSNQLHTITLPANASIDEIMFTKALKEYDIWQPIKHFFGKLNSGAKLLQCKNVFEHEQGKYQKEVLALLNECEKISLYQDNMRQILENYGLRDNFEGIRQICTELKGKLSLKDFAVIIEELARLSVATVDSFNALTPLLMEIWNDARDEDKRHVASTGFQSRIVDTWQDLIWEEDDMDYHFANRHRMRNPLVFIRALAEAYKPLDFLEESIYYLITWQPVASIVELIDEFQFSAEDVEKLKKNIRQEIVTEYLHLFV